MGFSLKRMFRHPFGSHSIFHAATHNPLAMGAITALVPPVGAAMAISKAVRPALGTLKAAYSILHAPAGPTALPGGAPAGGIVPLHRAHHARGRSASSSKARRATSSAPSRKRGGRKLKFGSPAWRAKYLKKRRAK